MNDRIDEIEEQAKVILEWCRQQRLPKEQRDIFELRPHGGAEWEWEEYRSSHGEPNFKVFQYRLRKRPKKHTATVYWWRDTDGSVFASLGKPRDYSIIGTSTVEFTEPQE